MKKILLLLSFLAAFFVSNAQSGYPIPQYIGRDSSLVDSRGGLKARLINYAFTDTTEANTQRISQYAGAMIYTTSGGDKLWLRSSDATLWTRVGTTSGGGNGIASLGTSAYGLITQNDSTYKVDTTLLSTKLWRQKGVDSVQSNLTSGLALKLNLTDTASMLSPYLRKIDTTNKWITSVYRKTASDSVFYVKGGTTTFAYRDSIGSGGGGGVTTIATINGTTKSANGAVISGSDFYMQTVDGTYPGLMTSAQKARLDSNSYLTIDKRYDSIAWRRNDSTFLIKSLRVQAYGTTQTPTLTDSSFSVNITTAPPTKQSVTSTSDTLHLVNDSTTLTNTKVYGYASGTRGWKDAINVTLTSPTDLQTLVYSSGTFINANKVDTIYRTAGKDSIIYLMSGVRYAIKDSTGGGGGGSAAGNYGNVQLNRNSALASPASDSLNFTTGLQVKGTYMIGSQVIARLGSGTNTSVYGNGGASATGAYNTLLGVGAGTSLTSGTHNTLLGSRSGGVGTISGTHNTAIGEASLYSLTNGVSNTAVGSAALQSNSTASSSTAVGMEALYSNNAANNTAIGRGAGYSNTSGTNNLLNGFQTGYYNTTGSNNTWVGYQAGLGVSANSNSNNTGVGNKALTAVTTGSNNIALGYQAADNLTSGTKNIVIGYDIDVPTATGSNQLSIGNVIFGTGVTGSGTTAAGKMGVLNNAPDSVLDVTGGFKVSGGVRLTGIPDGGTTSDSLLVATSAGQVKKINAGTFAIQSENQYTPTLTNTTNIAASTAYATFFTVIGSTVHVWGTVDIDATTASTVCEMGFSLPVSTSITQIYDVAGTASFEDNTSVQIKADVGNTRAVWRFTPQTNTNNKYSFHFTYKYTAP